MQEVIRDTIKRKDDAYHKTPEGSKKFTMCPCEEVWPLLPEATTTESPPPPTTEPRCPPGHVLEDGECVDRTDRTCPEGQVLEDGECVEPPEDGGSGGSGSNEPSDGGGNGGDNGDVIIED